MVSAQGAVESLPGGVGSRTLLCVVSVNKPERGHETIVGHHLLTDIGVKP